MIVPLKLPAGAFRNGTEYQAKGRWRDVNLVRWQEGAMRPVGGLDMPDSSLPVDGADALTDDVRAGLAWTDSNGDDWIIFGNFETCKVFRGATSLVSDLSPALTTSSLGSTRSQWQFAVFGEIPLACLRADGKLWEWDLNEGNNLTQVSGSPTSCRGVFVTPERFVWALGDGGDPRSIKWCDREDRTQWTPAVTNQAGGFDLDTEGEIEFALPMRFGTLVVTSRDVWLGRYIGYPDVYAFERVGRCTSAGAQCGAVVGDVAYWLGDNEFLVSDGSSVARLPCDVSDYVFNNMVDGDEWQTCCWHNEQFTEVWWLYPSTANTVDAYVAFNYVERTWHYGSWPSSAAVARCAALDGFPAGFFNQDTNPVTNPGFDSDSDWTKGSNWQISGGVASQTTPTASSLTQSISGLTPKLSYNVGVTIANRTAGSISISLGNSSSQSLSANGTNYVTLRPTDDAPHTLDFAADGTFDGDIDDVIVTVCPIMKLERDLDGFSAHRSTPYAKSGPLDIGDGERRVHVTNLIPDEQDQGELKYTFGHREYPTASETNETAVTAANPTDVRFSGRQFTMKVEPNSANTDWRCGVQRLEVAIGGRR